MKRALLLVLLALTGCEDEAKVDANRIRFEDEAGIKPLTCWVSGLGSQRCNGVLQGRPVKYSCGEDICVWVQ